MVLAAQRREIVPGAAAVVPPPVEERLRRDRCPHSAPCVSCIAWRRVAIRSFPPVLKRNWSSSRRCSSCAWARTDGFGSPWPEANAAAALPARAPNTRHSVSELDPNRFAPLMLTQAASPAAYSPGMRCGPMNVSMDASHHVMNDGPDRNHVFDWIESHVLEAQLADEGDLGIDHLPRPDGGRQGGRSRHTGP